MSFSAELPLPGGTGGRFMDYEAVVTNHAPPRTFTVGRLLRYVFVVGFVIGLAGMLGVAAIVGLVEGMDVHRYFQRTSSMRGAVSLVAEPTQKPYRNDPSCADGGGVCICTAGYNVTGKDEFGFRTLGNSPGSTACQQWHFEIGDVLLVEKPAELQQKYLPAFVQSFVSNSDIVHAAIVTKVPPQGVSQTGENVIVTEALKGSWKQVVQNTIRTLVERYPFGGVSIRRVDKERFPEFHKNRDAVTAWAGSRVGEPFDKKMLIPFKRRFTTGDRYISKSGFCWDRQRAIKMYEGANGGPGKWVCSQFVAWALAYPGGLNLNYADLNRGCDAPRWTVKNLQPLPGDLMTQDFYAAGRWKAPCDVAGCYIGVPSTPEWAGGTTSTTSTTSTSTSTTKTTTTSTVTTTSTSSTSTSTVATTAAPKDGLEGKGATRHAKSSAASVHAAPSPPAGKTRSDDELSSKPAKQEDSDDKDSPAHRGGGDDEVLATSPEKPADEEKRDETDARASKRGHSDTNAVKPRSAASDSVAS